jgi:hypothetical protein
MTVRRESEATTALYSRRAVFSVCVCVCVCVCVYGGENSLERRRWQRVRGTTVCGLTNVVRPNRRKRVDELCCGPHTTSLLSSLDVQYCMGNGSIRCVGACVYASWSGRYTMAAVHRKSMNTIVWQRNGKETKICCYGRRREFILRTVFIVNRNSTDNGSGTLDTYSEYYTILINRK